VAERYGKKAAPDAQEPESRSFTDRSACRTSIHYHTPTAISTGLWPRARARRG